MNDSQTNLKKNVSTSKQNWYIDRGIEKTKHQKSE